VSHRPFSPLTKVIPSVSLALLVTASSGLSQAQTSEDLEHLAYRTFKEGLRQYEAGAYWKAAKEFIVILDYYPSFSRLDATLYSLGECLYRMELYVASGRVFKHLVRTHPQSEWVPRALYGLERVAYQTKNLRDGVRYYEALREKYHNLDFEDGARYYAGQSHYELRNYDMAIAILEPIDPGSSFYDYALYTLGLAHLKKKASNKVWSTLRKL